MLTALGTVKTCVVGNSSVTVLLMQATQLSQLQDERASQQQVLVSYTTTCHGHAVLDDMDTLSDRALRASQKANLLTHVLYCAEQEAAEVKGTWKQVADENRSLNRQQHALSEDASRLKDRCGD